MCGTRPPHLLAIISIMCTLLIISANSHGFICLNTNLKFFQKFHDFQAHVERLFGRKILALQSDWGGEYHKLSTFS
jgi:hypothetical protein